MRSPRSSRPCFQKYCGAIWNFTTSFSTAESIWSPSPLFWVRWGIVGNFLFAWFILLLMGTIRDPISARGTLSSNGFLLSSKSCRSSLSLSVIWRYVAPFGTRFAHYTWIPHRGKFLDPYFTHTFKIGHPNCSQIPHIALYEKLNYLYCISSLRFDKSPRSAISSVLSTK